MVVQATIHAVSGESTDSPLHVLIRNPSCMRRSGIIRRLARIVVVRLVARRIVTAVVTMKAWQCPLYGVMYSCILFHSMNTRCCRLELDSYIPF